MKPEDQIAARLVAAVYVSNALDALSALEASTNATWKSRLIAKLRRKDTTS